MKRGVAMETKIADVISNLRQDHKNMALLLGLLEQQSNLIYEGDDPDFELLHDIMHYMTVYPDAVHHPKEDRIYAELKAVRPDLSAGFNRITIDHRQIAEMSIKLRDDIASADAGHAVHRKTIVADSLRYVNTLRSHMQWEELDLFRRVEEMVDEGHEFIEVAIFSHVPDPVFGPIVEQDFAGLIERIREYQ